MTMSMNEGDVKYFSFDGNDLIVDKENDDVTYNDEKHVYVGKKGVGEGKKFISVTTLIGEFENKFDSDFWKKYKALEELMGNDFINVKSSLLNTKKWDDSYIPDSITKEVFEETCNKYVKDWGETNRIACEYGTEIHAEQETGFYNHAEKMIKRFNLGGTIPVYKNHHNLDIDTGIIPEMLISYIDPEGMLRIAGQSDLIIKNGNHIKVWDWKTNKKLKQKSYFDPKKKKYQMMKYPLNNIMDCNFLHYTLQLSLYAWMLQKQNPNLIIDELRIVHFTHDGEVNEYVLEYLKFDIEKMLKYYKKQLILRKYEEENKPIIF